jgi:hypothetical protein
MMRIVRGIVFGALIGMVLGSLSRALMRLVAIGMGTEPEFDREASLSVVSLFVLSGAGAGAARAFDLRTWRLALVLVLSSAPLIVVGTAFSIDEIREILDRDLTVPWKVELILLSGVIVLALLLTPYAGWRAGRRRSREAG